MLRDEKRWEEVNRKRSHFHDGLSLLCSPLSHVIISPKFYDHLILPPPLSPYSSSSSLLNLSSSSHDKDDDMMIVDGGGERCRHVINFSCLSSLGLELCQFTNDIVTISSLSQPQPSSHNLPPSHNLPSHEEKVVSPSTILPSSSFSSHCQFLMSPCLSCSLSQKNHKMVDCETDKNHDMVDCETDKNHDMVDCEMKRYFLSKNQKQHQQEKEEMVNHEMRGDDDDIFYMVEAIKILNNNNNKNDHFSSHYNDNQFIIIKFLIFILLYFKFIERDLRKR